MTRIAGDWATRPETQAVFAALAPHRAWFVGGCVRDALLGRPVGDIDIATAARPETVQRLTAAAGLRPVPTGVDHGTVTVVSGGIPHEVTTLRRDVATDGRRATVAFAEDIAEDAARRDFTMNALYATPEGAVLDPLGLGVADLRAGRVRFVGAAERRIREDYLRSLRYFRFLAWYGAPDAGADAEALAAITGNLAGLDRLAPERLGHEMRRLLAAPDPAPATAAMAATGALARILPGAETAALAPLVHLEGATGTPPHWHRRLAALGGADPADRLRLPRADARAVAALRAAVASSMGPGELGYRLGAEAGRDAVLLRAAATGAAPDPGAIDATRTGAAAVFPVSAADLMPGLRGPALGARLRELEARWIASGFALGREALLEG